MGYSARRGFTNGKASGVQRQMEMQQKIQQMGTMAMALQQIGQIAAQMAMQLGDQNAAAMIQQIAMAAGGGAMGLPAGAPEQGLNIPQQDATQGIQPEKHPFVKKAQTNAQEATRPE